MLTYQFSRAAPSLAAVRDGGATAADVSTVVVDGTDVVTDGHHRLGDVPALLADAVGSLWSDDS